IVDEVLAVGDADFQKKSLGKMRSVAVEEDRTVSFVSHNLQAVQSLCDRAILLESGSIDIQDAPRLVVGRYLAQNQSVSGEKSWSQNEAPGNRSFTLVAVRVFSADGEPSGVLDSDQDIYIELDFIAEAKNSSLCIGFDLTNSEGITVFRTFQT